MVLLLRLLRGLFCRLSLPAAMAWGRFLGRLWFYLLPVRSGVAQRNVRRVFGDQLTRGARRRLVRRCFEHYAMMAVESLRLIELDATTAARLMVVEGIEQIDRARERGRGVIVVLAHLGNYELLAASQGLAGRPLHAVVRDFRNPAVDAFVAEARQRTNYRTIPPRKSKDRILELLAQNQIVAFLVDQHMPAHRGLVCDFFGMLASTSPAPTRFALLSGAPIFPATTWRHPHRPGHHLARVEAEFHLESPFADAGENLWHNTQRLNRVIEGWIREHPDQWLWMHKRWKVQDAPDGWRIPESLTHLAAGR